VASSEHRRRITASQISTLPRTAHPAITWRKVKRPRPASAEVVVEAVNDTHVRVATTGPIVMPKGDYLMWLREQIAAYEVSASA